jgi:hypothetical protein
MKQKVHIILKLRIQVSQLESDTFKVNQTSISIPYLFLNPS